MEQSDLIRRVVEVLEQLGLEHMIVGSVASGVYGEPRFTYDIDIVIRPRHGQIAQLCAAFPEDEYYVSLEAATEAEVMQDQFNLIHPASGMKVDLLISRDTPWGREQMARRRREAVLGDRKAYLASPEDVIISKMMYYREGGSEKHLRDITGILMVSGEEVDRTYIERWTGELGLTEIWESILARLGER